MTDDDHAVRLRRYVFNIGTAYIPSGPYISRLGVAADLNDAIDRLIRYHEAKAYFAGVEAVMDEFDCEEPLAKWYSRQEAVYEKAEAALAAIIEEIDDA